MSTGECKKFLSEIARSPKALRASTLKYYFRLKKRSRHAPCDSQQFPLSGKYPDNCGFAEFRQVDCAAMADTGGTFRRRNHGRKFRQHQARMKKKLVERIGCLGVFQLFQAVRFINRKFSDRRPFECGQVPARTQRFSEIVSQ